MDASELPEEFFGNATLQVVSLGGRTIQTMDIKEKFTPLNIDQGQGIYIINVAYNLLQKNFKVIVK